MAAWQQKLTQASSISPDSVPPSACPSNPDSRSVDPVCRDWPGWPQQSRDATASTAMFSRARTRNKGTKRRRGKALGIM